MELIKLHSQICSLIRKGNNFPQRTSGEVDRWTVLESLEATMLKQTVRSSLKSVYMHTKIQCKNVL